MNRFLVLAVLLVLVASQITGCSKPGSTIVQPGEDREYKLRLATVVSEPHPWIDMANYFATEVEKRTGGKVKVSVYPGGTLGNDQTTIDEMRIGTIDFVIGGTQNAAPFVPEFGIFGLSYLFESQKHFERVIGEDSPVFKHFQKLYEDKDLGLRLLSLSGGGTRNLTTNIKPVRVPEDLKGIKMRLPGSPIESKLWSQLGAVPTSLPWNEVYSAMQTGVVNAFESTISGYFSSKLYEVARYHSKTEHQYMVTHFSMSQTTYDKIPEQYRKVIEDVALEAGVLGTEKGKQADREILARLPEYKVEVIEVEKARFVEALAPLHDELAKELKASDILQMIRALK